MNSKEVLLQILNPICLHCSALGISCKGVTIQDWKKAKNCESWMLNDNPAIEKLLLSDYLISPEDLQITEVTINNRGNIEGVISEGASKFCIDPKNLISDLLPVFGLYD